MQITLSFNQNFKMPFFKQNLPTLDCAKLCNLCSLQGHVIDTAIGTHNFGSD